MKKVINSTLGLLTATIFLNTPLQAATVGNSFNVLVNLTSTCIIDSTTNTLNFGTYTAFGSASTSTPTAAISFKCTQGFVPSSVVLDTTAPLAIAAAAGLTTTGTGVIAGLRYTLTMAGVVSTTGSAATTTAGSGADIKSYTISGNMVSGQAGLSSTATVAATQTRTLTLTF
ncbi:hypothetical protein HC248_02404 [Polaromonas vacuolata]|uniref:Spore coat protein U domain-containing protein n=1 Tax=Polaromonas vacuolata TaxID=37448 RepID=A0A6H2HB36_9BURK|nr:hypothetical protein [Polaromonas vacuolata]QJC57088.1 hypothetical protein HC248_02404 [Polaromonas vacuolata]